MKILYHHRTQALGAEGVHIGEIVKALRKKGNIIFVVSPSGIEENLDISEGKNKVVKTSSPVLRWIAKYSPQIVFEFMELFYNLIAIMKMRKVLESHRIDLIYERNSFFCWAGVYLANRSKIPIILEVNEVSGIKRVRGQIFKPISDLIEKNNFKHADKIVVVSKFLKDHIAAMGIEKDKICVLPNGVDIDIFTPSVDKDVELSERINPNNKIVLGFVGGFVKWHNFEFLFEVLERIIEDNVKNISLMLVGDGPLKLEMIKIIESKKLERFVIFTGKIGHSDVPKYISLMDICLIPHSNLYRSPIKMFEYMAMSKTVVAPNLEPIASVITNGANGILFDPENIESFKKCLIDLAIDKNKRDRIGSAARETIVSNYLWGNNAEKILTLFKEIKTYG